MGRLAYMTGRVLQVIALQLSDGLEYNSIVAMHHYLRAEISVGAIRHNIAMIRNLLSDGTALCSVVKANAYGHGIENVLGAIGADSDMLAVFAGVEAIQLRQLGWERPILLLSPVGVVKPTDLAEIIASGVILNLTSLDELSLVKQASDKAHRPAEVHISVDTGMTREGVRPDQAAELVDLTRQGDFVKLTGMYTHFACADEADKSSALQQFELFMKTIDAIGGREGLILHAANSAATIDLPQTHLDMVRVGIAIYGYQPSDNLQNKLPLKPALRLLGSVAMIKDVPAGTSSGYGLTYTFDSPARIALVPIGYADGYPRVLSNVASVRIRGVDCPVRGRVSMDQIVVEITDVEGVSIGDEVEIISPDPQASNSVENLARLANTIPYEIVSRLGNRIERMIVD